MEEKCEIDDSQKFVVILERDVGLFSLFGQVLNTLQVLDEHDFDYIPVVIFQGIDVAV